MTEDSEELIAITFHRLHVAVGRCGERLVDGLVEARHAVEIVGAIALLPEAEHARAKGAILGDELTEPEASFES